MGVDAKITSDNSTTGGLKSIDDVVVVALHAALAQATELPLRKGVFRGVGQTDG